MVLRFEDHHLKVRGATTQSLIIELLDPTREASDKMVPIATQVWLTTPSARFGIEEMFLVLRALNVLIPGWVVAAC